MIIRKLSLILLVVLSSLYSYSQERDTLIIVVDTTASYVKYKEAIIPNSYFKYRNNASVHGKVEFDIGIDAHYYDGTVDADVAGVNLMKMYKGERIDIVNSEIKILKKDLSKYNLVSSEWINKELDEIELDKKFGSVPTDDTGGHFVTFKSELDDYSKDYIIIHTVFLGMGCVVY